jgi:hypothetical protein
MVVDLFPNVTIRDSSVICHLASVICHRDIYSIMQSNWFGGSLPVTSNEPHGPLQQ